mgnify:CR=1 FL=1|tara:strand:- start:65 stop:520 length:456 start_codon:yes stop_codon:yes gene_type:complete
MKNDTNKEEKKYENFNKIIRDRLADLSMKEISSRSGEICKGIFEEEDKDAVSVQGTTEDPTLDPEMSKEYFLNSFEEGDTLVTLKTIGVGRNKPVSVYFNEKRWEMFPGPKKAKSEAIKFIKSRQYEAWKERHTMVKKTEEVSSEDSDSDK